MNSQTSPLTQDECLHHPLKSRNFFVSFFFYAFSRRGNQLRKSGVANCAHCGRTLLVPPVLSGKGGKALHFLLASLYALVYCHVSLKILFLSDGCMRNEEWDIFVWLVLWLPVFICGGCLLERCAFSLRLIFHKWSAVTPAAEENPDYPGMVQLVRSEDLRAADHIRWIGAVASIFLYWGYGCGIVLLFLALGNLIRFFFQKDYRKALALLSLFFVGAFIIFVPYIAIEYVTLFWNASLRQNAINLIFYMITLGIAVYIE